MSEPALPEPLRLAGLVVAALLAAVAVLAPGARSRARAMLGALVLTPVLLVAEIWSTPQLSALRERPLVAAVGAALGVAAVAALAWALRRWPGLLALLAVAALPFRLPIESGGSTANLLVPLYVVIGAGVLAWAVPRLRAPEAHDPPRASGWLERILLATVVLYAVQAVYSSDTGKALQQVVFFYVPFALLFGLLRELEWTPRRVRAAFFVLLGLALVFAGVGFVEYALRQVLFNPKVIASNQVQQYFRVNSLFFDPNIYGRFLALVMLGLAGVLLWGRRSRDLALAMVGLAVLWGALLLTLSQSSFASLLTGLAVLAALRFRARWVLGAAAAAALAAAVLVLAFPSALRIDLGSAKTLNRATSGRSDLLRGGVDLARDRPLLGWGSGSFAREYRRRESSSRASATAASHTIPVTVAAEQGLVGLALYVALLVAALRRLLGRGARRSLARAVLAACFLALVAHTWMYAAFLEDPVTWTLLAVGVALARPRAEEADPAGAVAARRGPRTALAASAGS
jgi:O-antigen ligase